MAKGTEISVFATEEWDRAKSQAAPLVVLSEEQAKHLARHLDYWFGGIQNHGVALTSRDGTVRYDL